jgi:hypothetical protein
MREKADKDEGSLSIIMDGGEMAGAPHGAALPGW